MTSGQTDLEPTRIFVVDAFWDAALRYAPREDDEEQRLLKRMLELVRERPRYGYRFITVLLRREGWSVNRKRVYRLWQQESLQVPKKQRKKRRLGTSAGGCVRRQAEHKDHVWAWDLVFDRTENGRSIKWLSIVDEHTRECLALEVNRNRPTNRTVLRPSSAGRSATGGGMLAQPIVG